MNTWVFDLDNTLYPAKSKILQLILDDHAHNVSKIFKITKKEARKKAYKLYLQYGSTYAGLIRENIHFDFNQFYNFSQTIDYDKVLFPNQNLLNLIKELEGKKYIYSAGNLDHIEKTLQALQIPQDLFEGIFGYEDSDLLYPKPHQTNRDTFVNKYNIDTNTVTYFDDSINCIREAQNDGWNKCILINNGNAIKDIEFEQMHTVEEYLSSLELIKNR